MAAIAAVSLTAYHYATRPQAALCQVCRRGLHHGVNYYLEMGDGTRETACCPRCGMHLQVERPDSVRQAWATDLATGLRIPATAAVYVEGGDIEYCTQHSSPVTREPQGVAVRAFDRCLPSLVAFRAPADAELYRAEHGGRILNYESALASVKAR